MEKALSQRPEAATKVQQPNLMAMFEEKQALNPKIERYNNTVLL